MYTPEAKRKHGDYVLPLLFDDRWVGRIEPRLDRATQTLHIQGFWMEPEFELDEEGFAPAIVDALADFATFVGATRTTFPRGKPSRAVARQVANAARRSMRGR